MPPGAMRIRTLRGNIALWAIGPRQQLLLLKRNTQQRGDGAQVKWLNAFDKVEIVHSCFLEQHSLGMGRASGRCIASWCRAGRCQANALADFAVAVVDQQLHFFPGWHSASQVASCAAPSAFAGSVPYLKDWLRESPRYACMASCLRGTDTGLLYLVPLHSRPSIQR